jgi:hypothetical protein
VVSDGNPYSPTLIRSVRGALIIEDCPNIAIVSILRHYVPARRLEILHRLDPVTAALSSKRGSTGNVESQPYPYIT